MLREAGLTLLLIMRSRAWTWALGITLGSLALVGWVPDYTIVIEVGAGLVGRQIWSAEWLPVLVALCLTLALTPRFPLWERLGSARTRAVAATSSILVLGVALLLGWIRILWSVRVTGMDPSIPLVLLNNVYAATAAGLILVALLGRGWGAMAAVILYLANVQLQTRAPAVARWLPLLWGVRPDDEFDLAVRWPWLITLTLVLAIVVWWTRNVPQPDYRAAS